MTVLERSKEVGAEKNKMRSNNIDDGLQRATGDGGTIGAGIQVSPNMGRILTNWGVFEEIRREGVVLENIIARRWEDDTIIGELRINPEMEKKYGYPSVVVHRADLLHVLYTHSQTQGAVYRHNINIKHIDFHSESYSIPCIQTILYYMLFNNHINNLDDLLLNGNKTEHRNVCNIKRRGRDKM